MHEHATYDAAESVLFVTQYLRRYQEARVQFSHPRPPETARRWSPPPVGTIKANYDASVHVNPDFIGLGVVFRDWNGNVVAWLRQKLDYIQNPEVAEAFAVRLAVSSAQQMQIRRIIF